MCWHFFSLVFLSLLCGGGFCISARTTKSLTELYEAAKSSYLENDWQSCASQFEAAVKAYRVHVDINIRCKRQCKKAAFVGGGLRDQHDDDKKGSIEFLFSEKEEAADDDLQFYAKKVFSTLCLLKCKFADPQFHSEDEFTSKAQHFLYESLEAYNYLQLCYYQLDRIEEAANAAFTYYIQHQDDDVARANLQYYMGGSLHLENLTNAEEFEHTRLFYMAKESYEHEAWRQAASQFENTLDSYLIALEDCRLLCEKSFDHGWFPDFVSSVANHFTFCLKCKHQCHGKLANLDGNQQDNFLALLYNYLQYSYYQANDLKKATECIASSLLLDPHNRDMINNKDFFANELNVPRAELEDAAAARKEAINIHQQMKKEEALLDFIRTKFDVSLIPNEDLEEYFPRGSPGREKRGYDEL